MLAKKWLGCVAGGSWGKTILSGALRLIVGASTMSYTAELAQANTAFGNKNPVLAFNLTHVVDWETAMPFIDLMKTARPWIGNAPGKYGAMLNKDLRDGGYINEDGWLTRMPEGIERVETMWSWDGEGAAASRTGTYVVEYEGTGTLKITGKSIEVLSSEPGKIVFNNVGGDFFSLNIYATDPNGTGDYVRDITVMREKHADIYDVGAVFNPEWLEVIQDARELRFMDWMRTNNSEVRTWDDLPSVDEPNTQTGVAIEYMVQLANETGTIPWFNMPHMADEEYIRNFATYVRDNLDPKLQVKVEYSNEVWNWSFKQAHWILEQSKAEWGEGDIVFYTVKKSVETALIWEEVFAETGQEDQLVNVLGVQTANTWSMKNYLNPWKWKQYDPEGYVDPTTVFEEVAVTNYFGGNSILVPELRAELIAAIEDPNVDANAFLAARLMDPDFRFSIPHMKEIWTAAADLIHSYGLKMVAYEGGQHEHHTFSVAGLTEEQVKILTEFMIDFVRSDEMAKLYKESWKIWAELSDGPFNQFGEVARPTKWGSWGLYSHLGDVNPRAEMLKALSERNPWWDAEGGRQFQQGITETGTAGDDMMVGTFQEDYLVGKLGNDTFLAGGGNDGINGGAGIDRLVLSGNTSRYTIRVEGDGYRIDGPDGSDFILNVEELEFESGQIVQIRKLTQNADGTLTLPDQGDIKGGKLMNGEPYRAMKAEDLTGNKQGIYVHAIDTGSAVGQQLTFKDGKPSYVAFTREAADTVTPFITTEGAISADLGAAGSDSTTGDNPLKTVLKNGGIVTNSPKLVLTEGNDFFFGAAGADAVRGGRGDDRLLGKSGMDLLRGDRGDDLLAGQGDNDRLVGNGGNDVLIGGRGDDILVGGQSADTFVFESGDGNDIVRDFSQEDRLVLDGYLAMGQTVLSAAAMVGGNLVISNGVDSITFRGLDLDDLAWMTVELG